MTPIFLDWETPVTSKVTLKKMTLRQYLTAAAELFLTQGRGCCLAYAVGDVEPRVVFPQSEEAWAGALAELAGLFVREDHCFVSHNTSFDLRAFRYFLVTIGGPAMPWPAVVRDTLDLARYAWPNLAGGFSLANLGEVLGLEQKKSEIDLGNTTDEAMGEYCRQDVRVCQEIYRRALPRVSPLKLAMVEGAGRIRSVQLRVDGEAAKRAAERFEKATAEAAAEFMGVMAEAAPDAEDLFGRTEDGRVRSVRSIAFRRVLHDSLGFATKTTQKKKINPEVLRANPTAAKLVGAAAAANKSLWYARSARTTTGTETDLELAPGAAHTARWSAPSIGRGFNMHNLPKRSPVAREALRPILCHTEGMCWVSADLANVEYRLSNWLAGTEHTERIFAGNPLTDPYVAFWTGATSQQIAKSDPARKLAKEAVLGLSYLMAYPRWLGIMQGVVADPEMKVTLGMITEIATKQRWRWETLPEKAQQAGRDAGAPDALATVAWFVHAGFHRVHPNLRRLAEWIMNTVTMVAFAPTSDAARRIIDGRYQLPNSPERDRLDVVVEQGEPLGRSVRFRCGGADAPTVTYRDVRPTPRGTFEACFGLKGWRDLFPSLVIENVTQSCAWAGLAEIKRRLHQRGWPLVYSIHDAPMIVTPRTKAAIMKARQDLIEVAGPGNDLGYGPSVVINPEEITVHQSMLEDEKHSQRIFAAIAAGDEAKADELMRSLP